MYGIEALLGSRVYRHRDFYFMYKIHKSGGKRNELMNTFLARKVGKLQLKAE